MIFCNERSKSEIIRNHQAFSKTRTMKFFALTAGLTFAQDNIEVTTAAPSVNEVRV